MKVLEYDYVIVGSGLAGLVTAYHAAKHGSVALLSKSTLDVSNSYHAQGGIAVAIDEDDSPEDHYEDTLIAGRGLCVSDAVNTLVKDGQTAVHEFIELGMQFDTEDGELLLGLEGGHRKRRVLHAGGDATGRMMTSFILNQVLKLDNVTPFEFTTVVDLVQNNNRCGGIQALSLKDNRGFLINAKSTFLATGGISRVFSRSTNPKTATGDGIALAFHAGVQLRDMEFIQFHPSALSITGEDAFLISEAVRGEGAHLLDVNGVRFMPDIHPDAELAPRDIVSFSIFKQMQATKSDHVYLSLAHLDRDKVRNRFKTIVKELDKMELDLATSLIPVAPAAHYMVGGITTDLNGETSLEGLFAIGEVASTGVMGANRLASNSLLECLVFARRAVSHAVELEDVPFDMPQMQEVLFNEELSEEVRIIRNKLSEIMNHHVGIVRDEDGLLEAIDEILALKKELTIHNDEYLHRSLSQLIDVCELIAKAALSREESRGGHIREDHFEMDDAFKKHSIFHKHEKIKYKNII